MSTLRFIKVYTDLTWHSRNFTYVFNHNRHSAPDANMSDLAWLVDGPNAMDLASMNRSLHMHRQWTDTYTTCAQQEADLYANTSCMAACQSMQEALAKFRAYAQLTAMDTVSFDRYNKDCLLYTSPSPRDRQKSRMPSSA